MRTELVWVDDGIIYCLTGSAPDNLCHGELPEDALRIAAILSCFQVPWMFYRLGEDGYCSNSGASALPHRFGNARDYVEEKRKELQELVEA